MEIDIKTLMETQRRNMQAFSEAGQLAMGSWQNLARKQAEMMTRMVQDNSNIMQETLKEGTPEEKVARQAEVFKKAYEQSVLNSREMTELVIKSGKDTVDLINKRVSASINEIRDSLDSASKAA